MIISIWRASRKLCTCAPSLIQSIRHFFIQHDFLEVETPVRIPSPAPEEHIEAIPSGNWFLQTSPELCMKRLLAAGYPRIFQFCKCFRADERGGRHLPEFTMLEWYVAQFRLSSAHGSMRGHAHRLLEGHGIRPAHRLAK